MSGLPWAALAFGAVGAAAAVRTFWRPERAVIADGFALRCAGEAGCDPAMVVESYGGAVPVYALGPGKVLSATARGVHLALGTEPVVLGYDADPGHAFQPAVQAGAEVGTGQVIAQAHRVRLSVYVVMRDAAGKIALLPNEPASWLAARGLRISAKARAGQSWCEGGRKITVPENVGKCGIRLATPGGIALLPVSVTMG